MFRELQINQPLMAIHDLPSDCMPCIWSQLLQYNSNYQNHLIFSVVNAYICATAQSDVNLRQEELSSIRTALNLIIKDCCHE